MAGYRGNARVNEDTGEQEVFILDESGEGGAWVPLSTWEEQQQWGTSAAPEGEQGIFGRTANTLPTGWEPNMGNPFDYKPPADFSKATPAELYGAYIMEKGGPNDRGGSMEILTRPYNKDAGAQRYWNDFKAWAASKGGTVPAGWMTETMKYDLSEHKAPSSLGPFLSGLAMAMPGIGEVMGLWGGLGPAAAGLSAAEEMANFLPGGWTAADAAAAAAAAEGALEFNPIEADYLDAPFNPENYTFPEGTEILPPPTDAPFNPIEGDYLDAPFNPENYTYPEGLPPTPDGLPPTPPTPPGTSPTTPITPGTQLPAPVTDLSTAASAADIARNAGTAATAGSAISRILDGTGTAADWASVLGTIGSAGLGMYGANQQAEAQKELADKYWGLGEPYRAKLAATYEPGYSVWNDPATKDAANQAAQDATRQWSTKTGNLFDSPTGQAGVFQDVLSRVGLPQLNTTRSQLGTFGQLGVNPAGTAQMASIGSDAGVLNAAGYGLENIFNPKPTQPTLKFVNGGWTFV